MALAVDRLPVGLWWGTLFNASLPELIHEAARHGFATISVAPARYARAREAGVTAKDLRVMLDDTGVSVTFVDPLRTGLPGSARPEDVPEEVREGSLFSEDYCYDVAEAVEAKVINVAHYYFGARVPPAMMADGLGRMCERAAARGLDIAIEFVPESGIPDLTAATELVDAVGAQNLGVTFDTWHFGRTDGTLEQLAELPPDTIRAFQLSDRIRPPPDAPYVPRRGRSLPGEGEQPLPEMIRLARAISPNVPIDLEVYNAELMALDAPAAADLVSARVRTWLKGPGASVEW